jgi:hypothetical protein
MAVQLSTKKETELQAAFSNRNLFYRVLTGLSLAMLTTLGFTQNGGRDHAGPSGHQLQSGPVSPAIPRAAATHSAVTPAPHNATPSVTGRMSRPLPSSQAQPHHAVAVSRTAGGTRIEHQLTSGHRVLESTRQAPGNGTLHAVRYGNSLTGVVEHPMKAGYLSRTYVQGGHVLYARVYHRNTFQRFGRAFSYEALVPGVAFGAAYYSWAARPWATPVNYRWGWEAEPWHAAFGGDFQPYASYSSLDEWLTDYVIAQNMKDAYATWQAENAPPQNGPAPAQTAPAAGPKPDWESSGTGQRPYWESDDNRKPYWEESSDADTAAPAKSSKTHSSAHAGSKTRLAAEDAPPQLSGTIKAELNTQIKQQLAERQSGATASDADALPDSLKPGHTLFRVNAPLDVPSSLSGQYCSLRANDYIQRTGDMDENGMVPVKVKLGGTFDCTIGLTTRVSVNDLESMDNEQQQALTNALLVASRNMGDHGLPQGPDTTPVLLAAGQTLTAADASRTLSQLQ